MKQRAKYVLSAAAGCMALAATGAGLNAAILYNTGFDGTVSPISPVAYHDGTLAGQDQWTVVSSGLNPQTVSATATNGIVSLTNTGEDDGRTFFAASSTPTSIFLGADIDVTAAQTSGDYFLHVGQSSSIFALHLYAKKSGTTGYLLGVTPSNLNASGGVVGYGSTVLTLGTTVHVELEYDFVAGTQNDTAELYVNPVSSDPAADTIYATSTNGTGGALGTDISGSIISANLRQGSSSAAPTESVDNIVVSTDFASASGLVAVPEPTSLATIGLLTAGLLGRRRRAV